VQEGAKSKKSRRDDDNRKRLIAARTALGYTREQMADELLTPFHTYRAWEYGRHRVPGVATLAAEILCGQQGISIPAHQKRTKKTPVDRSD
jgi:DNA-binding XRE family transcriptional regulator